MIMRRLLPLLLSTLLLVSCASSRLYYWGGGSDITAYQRLTYEYYKSQSPDDLCRLLILYDDMVSHPGGKRGTVPPGICAEYGFLLLQPETASIFASNATQRQKKQLSSIDFTAHGVEMLNKEMELYPESQPFIAPLLQRLSHQ